MSDSSYSDYINDFDTARSLNGVNPKPRVPALPSPPREKDEEFTLEGWCKNGRISKRHVEENNTLSGFSDDSWTAEENDTSVFKNALVVLSDGLASMHRKGKASSSTPEVEKPAARATSKPKKKSVPPLRKKLPHPPKYRSSAGCQDRGKTSLGEILQETQESEQLRSFNKMRETSNSSRASIHLPSLDAKVNPHSMISQDLTINAHDMSSQNIIKGFEQNGPQTCLEVEREKMISMEQLPKTWNHLDQEVHPRSETPVVYEYVLKPAKFNAPNPPQNAPLSQKDLDQIITSKPNPLFNRNYNPPPKELKPSNTFRLGVFSHSDDPKVNKSILANKKILSPANNLVIPESTTGKTSKSDTTTIMPLLKTQKALLLNKETQNHNHSYQLRFEGLKQNVKRSKENEGNKSLPLSKKQSEITAPEPEGNRTSLRNVLGQVFNENQEPSSFYLNPREMYQLPEIKAPNLGEENIKKPIEYLLSLYKDGAEKALEKQKQFDQTTTGPYKVADFLKKLSDVQPKPKQFQAESLNNSLFGKEKAVKARDLGQRFSVKTNQSRNEVVFRLRRMKANYVDNNKLTIL